MNTRYLNGRKNTAAHTGRLSFIFGNKADHKKEEEKTNDKRKMGATFLVFDWRTDAVSGVTPVRNSKVTSDFHLLFCL